MWDNPPTQPVDPQLLAQHNKKDTKDRIIILERVKDHIIHHLFRKKTTQAMWATIIGLYHGSSEARELVLRDKLRNIRMAKSEFVVSYFTRFTQVRDELTGVGETISGKGPYQFCTVEFSQVIGKIC